MDLDKLTPLELHHLLYDVLEKLKNLPYVYDEKNNITHNDYYARNKQWYYDAREEIDVLIDQYGSA